MEKIGGYDNLDNPGVLLDCPMVNKTQSQTGV